MVVTFPLAYTWHLVVFERLYAGLGYFGQEPIIALGFAAILLQGVLLASLYPRVVGDRPSVAAGVRFGLIAGAFLWTSQVLAHTAKHHVASIPLFLGIETAYFLVQFLLVGLAYGLFLGRR